MNTTAFLVALATNTIIKIVAIAILMDTVFGVGRAIKERKFNSSAGIDGAIRKVAMVMSIVFLALIDDVVHINFIAFVPDEIISYLPGNISTVGMAELFGLLFLAYEAVSILKNMTLCGLPTRGIWERVQTFLGKYTDELPDTDGLKTNLGDDDKCA